MKNPFIKVVIECHTPESRAAMDMGQTYEQYKDQLTFKRGQINVNHIAGFNESDGDDQVQVYIAGGDSMSIQGSIADFETLLKCKYVELATFPGMN